MCACFLGVEGWIVPKFGGMDCLSQVPRGEHAAGSEEP